MWESTSRVFCGEAQRRRNRLVIHASHPLLRPALFLLLPQSPLSSVQHRPPAPRPLASFADANALALRVKRAERAYQKMLRGREALIAKVGPSPHDVALCVVLAACNCSPFDYPQIPTRQAAMASLHRLCVHSCPIRAQGLTHSYPRSHSAGDFFPPEFSCPHELERVSSLGDG